MWGSVITLAIMMVVLYFALVRPAQKAAKNNNTNNKKVAPKTIVSILFYAGLGIVFSIIVTQSSHPGVTIIAAIVTIIIFVIIPTVANAISKSTPAPTAAKQNAISRVEKLTKLKELLDSGVITQEEFDAKKKELLNQ